MPLSERYRTALVTGSGSGLGRAFAAMLISEGLRVWGTSRAADPVAVPGAVAILPLELASAASIEAAWTRAEGESGGIDLLVNNAGACLFGAFAEQTPEEWERQVSVLALGPARLARLALAAMRLRGRGCIVNVSSVAVDLPIPFMSGYNAGKAALSALTASLELEAAGGPVAFVDFRPADHNTRFNRSMADTSSHLARDAAGARVWARLEALAAAAPPPADAARDLRRALAAGRHGTVRSGSLFQAGLAPFLNRLAPAGLARPLHRRYFDAG